MGYYNIDMGSSGLHPGILSLFHWLKYYFIDICYLTNLAGDNSFWIAGLNSAGSSISIQYNATFASTNTATMGPPFKPRHPGCEDGCLHNRQVSSPSDHPSGCGRSGCGHMEPTWFFLVLQGV
jgi:hypothetical protein